MGVKMKVELLVDRTLNGGIQDKNISAGKGFAHFDRQDMG